VSCCHLVSVSKYFYYYTLHVYCLHGLCVSNLAEFRYGPAMGHPPLVEALRERLRNERGIFSCPSDHDVMITQGANQVVHSMYFLLLRR
jgi:DNA-binding transcriptional MocR family regulator